MSIFFYSKNCQNLADSYDIFRLLLKNVLEAKLQTIEAAPGDVFKKVKNCLKTSNFVDFSKKI